MRSSVLLAILAVAVAIGVAILFAPGFAANLGKTYYVPGYTYNTGSSSSSASVAGAEQTYFQTEQLLRQVGVIVPSAVKAFIYDPYGDYWVSFTNATMAATPAVDGGVAVGAFNITRNSTSIGKIVIRVSLQDLKALSMFFQYLNVYLYYVVADPKTHVPKYVVVKAKLTLDDPTAVITITGDEFKDVCVGYASGGKCPIDTTEKTMTIFVTVAYGVKPNVTITQIPMDIRIDLIGAYKSS